MIAGDRNPYEDVERPAEPQLGEWIALYEDLCRFLCVGMDATHRPVPRGSPSERKRSRLSLASTGTAVINNPGATLLPAWLGR
jgi:hypothetical protein